MVEEWLQTTSWTTIGPLTLIFVNPFVSDRLCFGLLEALQQKLRSRDWRWFVHALVTDVEHLGWFLPDEEKRAQWKTLTCKFCEPSHSNSPTPCSLIQFRRKTLKLKNRNMFFASPQFQLLKMLVRGILRCWYQSANNYQSWFVSQHRLQKNTLQEDKDDEENYGRISESPPNLEMLMHDDDVDQ